MKNKLYKFKIASVKYEPIILALANFVSNLFYDYNIDTFIINVLFGSSILLITKMMIDSIIFKFCIWHQVLIGYSLISNIINWYDSVNPLKFTQIEILNTIFIISFIFLVVTIILRLKYGCRKVENN